MANPETTREQQLEVALRKLCEAVQSVTKNHVLTVAMSQNPLTEDDFQAGNTQERQEGFLGALQMVHSDYVMPLVAVHDEVASLLGKAVQ